MNKELLQQALDALDLSQSLLEKSRHHSTILLAYTALAKATAQPVQPVIDDADFKESVVLMLTAVGYTEAYARQWPKEKVSITFKRWFDEQIENAKLVQQEQEPVYQYQLANGNWIDQAKESYDYNVKLGQAVVRVLYTSPKVSQPVRPMDRFIQAVTDPENQPSQYGTVTIDYYLARIKEWEEKFDRAMDKRITSIAQPVQPAVHSLIAQLSDSSILNLCSCDMLMPLRQAGDLDDLLVIFARTVIAAQPVQLEVNKPIGFISAEHLANLENPEWRESLWVHANLWSTNSPPSRAVIPVYVAQPVQPAASGAVEDAACICDAQGAWWRKQAQKHLPHHNSDHAQRDIARAKICESLGKKIRSELTNTQPVQPAGYVNGDELDNMLEDRTTIIQTDMSGYRKTPLYRAIAQPVQPCTGCNGHGEVGGLRSDGYDSEICPYCKGVGTEQITQPAQPKEMK